MIKNILKYLRKFLLSNRREKNLAKYFFLIISKFHKHKKINILDFGSGFEPIVANLLKKKLDNDGYEASINCYDFYLNIELRNLNYSKNLKFNKLKDLEFDKKKYDFAIISDTLHHIGVKKHSILKKTLKLLKSKSKFLLIKDHYQYSIFSRFTLIFMDFIGNYYNNVKIPESYFTKKSFEELIKSVNLKIVASNVDKKYYRNIFLFFNNPNLHFIYLLK